MKQAPAGRKGRAWLFVLVLPWLPQPLAASEDQKVEPAAPARVAAETTSVPGEDTKATKKLPRRLLRQVLGCWLLDGQERWTISRLDVDGAQVVTKLLKRTPKPALPDQANRVAVPATLMYDTRQGNFGFATAARAHPALVVFKSSGSTLEASFYSKRSAKDRYAPTGHTATLQRCKGTAHARPPRATPPPPRLK